MSNLPILIVEDDQPLRSLLAALLSQNGYAYESGGDVYFGVLASRTGAHGGRPGLFATPWAGG